MEYEITHRPSYSLLKVKLGEGESITAESGAMVYMSPNIEMQTSTRGGGGLGGLLKSLKVAALGAESFWINTFTAKGGEGEVALAPAIPGDVHVLELSDEGYIVQSGSYLASTSGIEVDTRWQGFRGLLAEGDLFMLHISGSGKLFVAALGALEERELSPGERLTIDNGHLVAWSDSMRYDVRRVGGLKSLVASGEGLVVDIEGPGRVVLQTRNPSAFINWLLPFLSRGERSDRGLGIRLGI